MARIITPGPCVHQYTCPECQTVLETDLLVDIYHWNNGLMAVTCPSCQRPVEIPEKDVTTQMLRQHCPFLFDE